MWLRRTIVVLSCSVLVQVAAAKEAQELFNGKDLAGWDGNPAHWSVEDGAIIGRNSKENPLKHNEFLIWKDGKVSDFKLRLQFRIEGGNSGVQYRSKIINPKEWIVGGYQADIDAANKYAGIMYEERGRGILAERGQRVTISDKGERIKESFGDIAKLSEVMLPDEWNDYEIEARGPRMTHSINGKLMSETIDHDEKNRAKAGVLALQIHAGPPMTVKFRKIEYEAIEARPADESSVEKK